VAGGALHLGKGIGYETHLVSFYMQEEAYILIFSSFAPSICRQGIAKGDGKAVVDGFARGATSIGGGCK
jgi:hypothetical protein